MVSHSDIEIEYNLKHSRSEDLIHIHIGSLVIPTGKLIAGDPYLTFNVQPYARNVQPGTYPVELFINNVGENHFRVAFARLIIGESSVTRWILAVTEDMDLASLNELSPDDFIGFSVDGSIACFADQKANELFNKQMDDSLDLNDINSIVAHSERIENEFRLYSSDSPYSSESGDWNNHVVDEKSGLNVLMFSSGWGDGVYQAFWGYDANGNVVELIIDFLVYPMDK